MQSDAQSHHPADQPNGQGQEPKLIGEALLGKGLLSQAQLEHLLTVQRKQNQRLGEAAVALGFLQEAELSRFLADFFGLPYVELAEDEELNLSAVELLPEALARRYLILVINKQDHVLTVAMADPLNVRAIDAVRLETQCRIIRKVVSSRSAILRAIDRSYHAASRLATSMDRLVAVEAEQPLDEAEARVSSSNGGSSAIVEELKHEASDAPVVQFVNLLLMRALQERASDIHIEPEEQGVTIRLRIDGQLREVSAPPKSMFRAITTRIKLLGNLDISERRLPQDGRFNFSAFDKTIDVRLSSLPTVHGEKLVLRILDRGSVILSLESLGFESPMLATFNRVLQLPYGLVILTGPTGSGKTTTLYAALNTIKTPTKNIVTVEDPVEYQLSKINQVHTKASIGLTFAAGLRSILRQDPDIIMVGEIRDRETADICIRSALTGHLVLSTLHTNDAVSAMTRLTDMGVEPFLLTASLSLVMAQRLVRRICEDCSAPWEPPAELRKRLTAIDRQSASWTFRRGTGCSRCGTSGYLGRIAIYEQFVISEHIKALVAEGAKLHALRKAAEGEGLQTLLKSALHKVRDGVTTLDEAFSVCATQAELFE